MSARARAACACRRPAELERHVAPRLRPARFAKACSTVRTMAPQAGRRRAGTAPAGSCRSPADGAPPGWRRTRSLRSSTTRTPSAISSITSRFSAACWRASPCRRALELLARQAPASSPASTVMTKGPAGQRRLQSSCVSQARPPNHATSSISATAAAVPAPAARRQHAGHQHRQHQQRRVVEAGARRQQPSSTEGQQVDTDGAQPRANTPRERLPAHRHLARQQPQHQRQRAIGDADQRQPRARPARRTGR